MDEPRPCSGPSLLVCVARLAFDGGSRRIAPLFMQVSRAECAGRLSPLGQPSHYSPQGHISATDLLNETHPGMSRIKSLARSYVWWRGMDAELEAKVRDCPQCQEDQETPAKALLHPWEFPECPWAWVHADLLGPSKAECSSS